jgi:hypothetical protein
MPMTMLRTVSEAVKRFPLILVSALKDFD